MFLLSGSATLGTMRARLRASVNHLSPTERVREIPTPAGLSVFRFNSSASLSGTKS
jgi:hypothetical protein